MGSFESILLEPQFALDLTFFEILALEAFAPGIRGILKNFSAGLINRSLTTGDC
jgi:hypothetical protein